MGNALSTNRNLLAPALVIALVSAHADAQEERANEPAWMQAFTICAQEPQDPDASIAACTEALESGNLEPMQSAAAHYNRGRVHSAQEDYEQAVDDFNAAIAINELDPAFYHDRGTAQRKAQDYEAAIASYTKATDLGFEPKFGVYFNRGVAYHYKGDKDAALKDFQRADMLQPGHPQVQKVLRDMYGIEPAEQ